MSNRLGSGGEADVFALAGAADLVAKIYHTPPDAKRASKLAYMVRLQDPDLMKVAAWPVATVHSNPGSAPIGFLMPRMIEHKEIHVLYGPGSRRKEFPNATWAFLAHVAMNTAAAFESVHARGAVIADVNAKNIVVSNQAMVRLLDCDSFQIVAGAERYLSEVGVPEYTPPELQGIPFSHVVRTSNHDCFGLAVVIFHLLFMGRHPFFGAFSGRGDMSQERAIKEFRFAYGSDAKKKQMRPPPHSLPLHFLSNDVSTLFELAFSPRGAQDGRPSASRWLAALKNLNAALVTCSTDTTHKYPASAKTCAWCEIAAKGGPSFFYSAQVALAFSSAPSDLDEVVALCAELEEQRAPAPVALTALQPTPTPLPPDVVASKLPWPFSTVAFVICAAELSVAAGYTLRSPTPPALVGCILGVAIGIGLLLWRLWFNKYSAFGIERASRNREVREARLALGDATRARNELDRQIQASLQGLRTTAVGGRNAYTQLKPSYDNEIAHLERNAEGAQRRAYLDSHEIRTASITNVGDVRKANLRSYGIETALDVLERDVSVVPNIGERTAQALVIWARGIDSRFRFDPRKAIPESERRLIVQRYRVQQQAIRQRIEMALSNSREETGSLTTTRPALILQEQDAATREEQAKTDVSLTGEPSRFVVPIATVASALVAVVVAAVQPSRPTEAQRVAAQAQPGPTVSPVLETPTQSVQPPRSAPTPKKPQRRSVVAKKPVMAADPEPTPVDPYLSAGSDMRTNTSVETTVPDVSAPVQLPETLDESMLVGGIDRVGAEFERCYAETPMPGRVRVSLRILPDGSVASATVQDTPSTGLGRCVSAALESTSFERTQKGGMFLRTITFPR